MNEYDMKIKHPDNSSMSFHKITEEELIIELSMCLIRAEKYNQIPVITIKRSEKNDS
jgi:hypothetical protein